MKKILLIIFFLITVLSSNIVHASSTEEMVKEQEKSLGIDGFIKQSQKYTEKAFEDIDVSSLYKDALTGNIEAEGALKGIIKILGSEVTKTITSLGYILIIIIIHSIIKSISEGMGNNSIGEITYYVQYVLIVTLIMTNFTETISIIKETVTSLVGFINCLLPILLALMITTRKYSYSIYNSANITSNYDIYCKFYNKFPFATCINRNSTWNSIKNIRQNTNR